jgi:galactose oxidase-like protein
MRDRILVSALDAPVSRRALLSSGLMGAAAVAVGALTGVRTSRASGSTPRFAQDLAATGGPLALWTLVTPAAERPPARRDHTLTADLDRGLLYVFGGRTRGSPLGDLWIFDPSSATWSEIVAGGPKPAARFGHNATYDTTQQRLVVALGQGRGGAFFNDVWAFDSATRSWSELAGGSDQQPRERYGAGIAPDYAGGRFYISHGFTDAGRFDDTWVFDLNAQGWQQIATSGPVPLKRCLLRAGWDASNQRLLLFGGQSDPRPFLGDFWSLDVPGGRWSEKMPDPLPGARNLYGATSDASGRRWYVFGGNTPHGPSPELWVYDADRDAWSTIGNSPGFDGPSAREALDITAVGANVYLFGGSDGRAELDDSWMFQLAS